VYNIFNSRDIIKKSDASNSSGSSNRSETSNRRDARNSRHDSDIRDAIISRRAIKKGLSAIVSVTEGKQSITRIQATAVLQGR
jgi:hypothetical protein